MVIRRHNPWESETRSDLVSCGTHQLFVSTSGPVRKPGEPVILFFQGGGSPVATHIRLQKLISGFARCYFYDRSGYDMSERGPNKILTAQDAATELSAMLANMHVEPPFVLVGVSYGGIVMRAFFRLHQDDVVGMVLAEAGTELMYQMFPHVPDEALQWVAAGVDLAELTNLRRESGLTDEEWERAIDSVKRTEAAAKDEDNHGSAHELAKLLQFQSHVLDPWPVSVLRCNMAGDFHLMYAEGVRRGQGTKEQREKALSFIKTFELFDYELRAAQLRLSSLNRYVHEPKYGHDVSMRRPEILTEQVRWVLREASKVKNELRSRKPSQSLLPR